VSSENLSRIYRDYIACLNEQAWLELEWLEEVEVDPEFVALPENGLCPLRQAR